MPPKLRPYQGKLKADTYAEWDAGAVNVMAQAATGAGKTVGISALMNEEPGASIACAHRQELVSQISIALARNGVRHRIVGAKKGSPLTRIISVLQVAELGYSFLDPTARAGVGGIDTIIRMKNEPWFDQVRLQVHDEGHHVLAANKWGIGVGMFRNARGYFPTATPKRADGKGLGRHHDGLMDALVQAPSMREIINMGYLTDYKVLCPPSNLDISDVHVTASGEFSEKEAARAIRRSTVTGDIVMHYKRHTMGKLGVTFTQSIEEATRQAQNFRDAGVRAEVVTGQTPIDVRNSIIRRFANREILQLVNVDLFGEGFDLPAIEVVSMGRLTDSFAVYSQEWGRALRLMLPRLYQAPGLWDSFTDAERRDIIKASDKPVAWIFDHVGNFARHGGPPDKPMAWSLDRRDKRASKKSDAIPIKTCVQCLSPFEAFHKRCPYCEHYMPPANRSAPEYVEGDLTELDPNALALLRGEIERIDGDPVVPWGAEMPIQLAARKNHILRQEAQGTLRNAIAWWAGVESGMGHSESESYRRFFFRFGTDVANAQILGAREALELAGKINLELGKLGIDGTVNAMRYFTT